VNETPFAPETLVPREPRLGDILVQAGLIDELQLHTALAEQQQWGNRLGVALVKLGMIDEQELLQALSRKLGAPAVRLQGKRIDPAVLALVPRDLAERHACLPLFTKQEAGVEVIYVGMEDPGDLAALDELRFRTGLKVRPVIVAPTELWETLDRSYRRLVEAPDARPSGTPTDPGETAPHLANAGSETADERNALLPRSWAPNPASAPPTGGSSARPDDRTQESPPTPSSESGTSRVPTRSILRALTQLLLEKELIDRDELLQRIQAVEERSD
jgi:type IV pilus assembly protein PilB